MSNRDTRNKHQKIYDAIYAPKIAQRPGDVRQTATRNGQTRVLIEKTGHRKRRQPRRLQWLPASVSRDSKVSQALAQVDQKKLEALRNFKYN